MHKKRQTAGRLRDQALELFMADQIKCDLPTITPELEELEESGYFERARQELKPSPSRKYQEGEQLQPEQPQPTEDKTLLMVLQRVRKDRRAAEIWLRKKQVPYEAHKGYFTIQASIRDTWLNCAILHDEGVRNKVLGPSEPRARIHNKHRYSLKHDPLLFSVDISVTTIFITSDELST